MDKLNLLKLFVSVVDRGSFAAAAVDQGLSPSTVSKAISRLEEDLQVRLFHRTTRQLRLTASGQDYLKTVRHIVSDLEQCEARLVQSNEKPTGHLSINLPISYGRLYVLPLIDEFNQKFPEISVELSFDDAYVDMIERGIDISLRSGTLEESTLIARQLSPIDFLICAAPDYLGDVGEISVNDYEQHPWIRFRYRQTGRLMPIMIPRKRGQINLDPGRQFIVDDGEALAELCAQGLGLTQIPHFIARDWIKRGELYPIAPLYRPRGHGVWVIYATREFLPEKIRVFVEFLQQKVRALGETPRSTWAENKSTKPM